VEANVSLATEERTQRQRSGRGSVLGAFYLVLAIELIMLLEEGRNQIR
jgi:hypothetical protein